MEGIDSVGDAGVRNSKWAVFVGSMEECSTVGVSSQYLVMGWYSFELGGGMFEEGWEGRDLMDSRVRTQDAATVRTWDAAVLRPYTDDRTAEMEAKRGDLVDGHRGAAMRLKTRRPCGHGAQRAAPLRVRGAGRVDGGALGRGGQIET